MFSKKMIMLCLVLLFLFQIIPAKVVKDTQYYIGHARTLIRQAIALGPARGSHYLRITNPDNGAMGAANFVAKEDPREAAVIMIEIGETMIDFARLDPTRGEYYTYAEQALWNGAIKYIDIVSKTNPLIASDMAIRVSGVFSNANPSITMKNNRFRLMARMCMSDSPKSAKTYANKIKDAAARKLQIQKVKTLYSRI